MLISPDEVSLIGALGGAVLGAIIGGAVSFFVARYTIKHGPNYEDQIEGLDEKFEGLHETMGKLANTQEKFRLQQEAHATEERDLRSAQEKKSEEARWKPNAEIISSSDGVKQMNKLTLTSNREFLLLEVSLLSESGAKIFDYPMNKPNGCSTGFGVAITYESLCMISNSSQTYRQHNYFDANLRFRVSLGNGDGSIYSHELPFRARQIYLNNTSYFILNG